MLTDFRSQQIKVGDTIAYALRRASRQWLNEGKVIEIGTDFLRVQRTRPVCDRLLTLRSLGTVVVVGDSN